MLLEHWSFPRPKNKLDSIIKALTILNNILLCQKKLDKQEINELYAIWLETEGVKKQRKPNVNTASIGQSYISWLKSLKLISYSQDTHQLELSEDVKKFLEASDSGAISDILSRNILAYEIAFGSNDPTIHPFIFILKILKETGYLTKKEIAEIVIVKAKNDTDCDKIVDSITESRALQECLPNEETESVKNAAVVNTIINWLTYTGVVRYDSVKKCLTISDEKKVYEILENNIYVSPNGNTIDIIQKNKKGSCNKMKNQSFSIRRKDQLEKGIYFVHGYYSEEIDPNWPNGDHIILFRENSEEPYDIVAYDLHLKSLQFDNNSWFQGHYVVYNGEEIQIANNEEVKRYIAYNQDLIQSITKSNNYISELSQAQATEISDISEVFSYHINVGHGNCSIIVFKSGTQYSMWMVDCSTYDFINRTHYNKNIDACLSDIQKNYKATKLSKLFITHLHYDHINGIQYLLDKNLIDQNTEVWMNISYPWPQRTYNKILQNLKKSGAKFIDPIVKNSTNNIEIRYPKKSFDKNHPAPKNNINNASVLYQICLDGERMLFTGDLEQEGWDSISDCKPYLWSTTYYCISHHGSLNGHKRFKCTHSQAISSLANCGKKTQLQILMGRNGAYKGIFSSNVKKEFRNIKCTDGNKKYVKIDWKTGSSQDVI